jgi:hypothetical protein
VSRLEKRDTVFGLLDTVFGLGGTGSPIVVDLGEEIVSDSVINGSGNGIRALVGTD